MNARIGRSRRWAEDCGVVRVLVIGRGGFAQQQAEALARHGHPVRQTFELKDADLVPPPRIVLIAAGQAREAFACADDLRARLPGVRVVVAAGVMDEEMQEGAAMREFVRLRLQSTNRDEFHDLVHRALVETQPPTPEALPAQRPGLS